MRFYFSPWYSGVCDVLNDIATSCLLKILGIVEDSDLIYGSKLGVCITTILKTPLVQQLLMKVRAEECC